MHTLYKINIIYIYSYAHVCVYTHHTIYTEAETSASVPAHTPSLSEISIIILISSGHAQNLPCDKLFKSFCAQHTQNCDFPLIVNCLFGLTAAKAPQLSLYLPFYSVLWIFSALPFHCFRLTFFFFNINSFIFSFLSLSLFVSCSF